MFHLSFNWITVLVFVLTGISCSGSKNMIKVESKFQSTTDSLSIDTYPDPSGFSYSPEDQTYFLVKNTPDYLMVYFEFEGAQTARQLLIGGGELWINLKGKKKKTFGVKYPLLSTDSFGTSFSPRSNFGDQDQGLGSLEEQLINQDELVLLYGKDEFFQYHLEQDKVNTILFVDSETGNLKYGAMLPLKEISPDITTWSEIVSIGFNVGELPEPEGLRSGRSGSPPGGGRSPGGGGFRGPPGGGSPSGGFRGNSRQNQNQFEPLEFWLKVSMQNN